MRSPVDYNPGSPDAVRAGCTCPVLDNNHGAGIERHLGRDWWINAECPLHGVDGGRVTEGDEE